MIHTRFPCTTQSYLRVGSSLRILYMDLIAVSSSFWLQGGWDRSTPLELGQPWALQALHSLLLSPNRNNYIKRTKIPYLFPFVRLCLPPLDNCVIGVFVLIAEVYAVPPISLQGCLENFSLVFAQLCDCFRAFLYFHGLSCLRSDCAKRSNGSSQ